MRPTTMRRLTFLAAAGASAATLCAACSPAKTLPKTPTEPYLQRITSTGGAADLGPIDTCIDPGALRRMIELRRTSAPAPKPLVGCTHSGGRQPDGSVRYEMTCDRANGARSSFHMVRTGTPGDMRSHTETYGFDPNTGAPKTTIRDTHIVRLGPCPPDLKPGQMRMGDGTIMNGPSPEQLMQRLARRRDEATR